MYQSCNSFGHVRLDHSCKNTKKQNAELTIGIRTLDIKRGVRDSNLLYTIVQLVSLSPIGRI